MALLPERDVRYETRQAMYVINHVSRQDTSHYTEIIQAKQTVERNRESN